MNVLRRMFSRRKLYGDLSDEIRAHLEERTEELVAAGLIKEDAAAQARREFGNVLLTEERGREVWQWTRIESLFADLRFGLRMLRKSPGFTAVAILTLALGIGANTAIFSLINAVALRSLPVPNPQQLVVLQWQAHDGPSTYHSYNFRGCHQPTYINTGCSFSYPMFEQIRTDQTPLSGICALISRPSLVTVNGQTKNLDGAFVSGDFFPVLGARAAIGRTLDPLDDVARAQPVIVLGYAYWREELGADPNVIGKTAILHGNPFRIVGVAQRGFQLNPGIPVDFWIPLIDSPQVAPYLPERTAANSIWLMLIARLKPGVKASQAQAALDTIFIRASTTGTKPIFKASDAPQLVLESASTGLSSLREDFSSPLFVLMAAVALILLIACANVAGLALARSSARQKEMAVRRTLGAPRLRMIRQLLTESVLLSGAGGALGVFLAVFGARAIASFFAANWGTLQLDAGLDGRVLVFTVVISVLVGILFGLAPALHSSRTDAMPALKQGGVQSGAGSRRRSLLNGTLIVAQVAISIVVLDGAALLVRTLSNLRSEDVGFEPQNIVLFDVSMELSGYKLFEDPRAYAVEKEIRNRMAALPGVSSATYSSIALLSDAYMSTEFNLPGRPQSAALSAYFLPVGPDFFETMNIPLLAGRTFTPADFESTAKPEPIVINQRLARKLFGNENPLGRGMAEAYSATARFEVIGLVRDAKYSSLRRDPPRTAYTMFKDSGPVFELRTSLPTRALVPFIRRVVGQVDPKFMVTDIKTQSEQVDQLLYQERLVAALSSLFGILAIVLVSIGLYGLVAYGVGRRTHEIGVRLALGAQPTQVLGLMAKQGLLLTLAGIAVGVGVASGVTRYLQTLLYGVRPTDPWTFAAMSLLLASIAVLACYVPARRAMRVDPMVALKYE